MEKSTQGNFGGTKVSDLNNPESNRITPPISLPASKNAQAQNSQGDAAIRGSKPVKDVKVG